MNKFRKFLVGALFLTSFTHYCYSQEDSPVQFGVDLMSRYVWRGLDLGGESPSIQPALSWSFNTKDENHSFTLGAWGAYNFNTSFQEVDLYFNYTYKELLSFTFTDYYFPGLYNDTDDASKYFNYNKNTTGHLFESIISFNGTEKFPFSFLFAMNLYGADSRHLNDDGSSVGIMMSKYIEGGYNRAIKGVDFNAFVGLALDNPDEEKGEVGFYGDSAGVVNLGIKATKSVQITDSFELPMQVSLITNPQAEKIYIVFGISF